MKGKVLGSKMHLELHWQILYTVKNPRVQPTSLSASLHVGRTQYEGLLVPKEQALETPRTLFGTSQIIFYRCQRQLQISSVQPEVFIQEPTILALIRNHRPV